MTPNSWSLSDLIRYREGSYMQRQSVAQLEGYPSPWHAQIAGEPLPMLRCWWFWYGWNQ